jgi:hypothetical protein
METDHRWSGFQTWQSDTPSEPAHGSGPLPRGTGAMTKWFTSERHLFDEEPFGRGRRSSWSDSCWRGINLCGNQVLMEARRSLVRLNGRADI